MKYILVLFFIYFCSVASQLDSVSEKCASFNGENDCRNCVAENLCKWCQYVPIDGDDEGGVSYCAVDTFPVVPCVNGTTDVLQGEKCPISLDTLSVGFFIGLVALLLSLIMTIILILLDRKRSSLYETLYKRQTRADLVFPTEADFSFAQAKAFLPDSMSVRVKNALTGKHVKHDLDDVIWIGAPTVATNQQLCCTRGYLVIITVSLISIASIVTGMILSAYANLWQPALPLFFFPLVFMFFVVAGSGAVATGKHEPVYAVTSHCLMRIEFDSGTKASAHEFAFPFPMNFVTRGADEDRPFCYNDSAPIGRIEVDLGEIARCDVAVRDQAVDSSRYAVFEAVPNFEKLKQLVEQLNASAKQQDANNAPKSPPKQEPVVAQNTIALGSATCSSCKTRMVRKARFCHHCGAMRA